uniref:CDP-alcohol phosphatidyltransferase family protein n=1 Tax=Pedococcus sp. 5OH_020 TaxID=2989814 RepID=UPI0022E9F0E4|nr:CDP-alcohol phosphatidyltransferase family protein [Pedococcus sp. 5OH_020]
MSRAGEHRPDPTVVLLVDDETAPGAVRLVASRACAEAGTVQAVLDRRQIREWLGTAPAAADVVVLDGGWLAPATVYGDLVADPRPGPAVLTDGAGAPVGVRTGSAGAVALSGADCGTDPSNAATLARLAASLRARGPVREVQPGRFPSARTGTDPESARALTDAVDEAALRLRRASRSDDGFLSVFLIRPLSRQVTGRLVTTSVSPAQVTTVSLVLGLASAVAYAGGSLAWLVLGSLLLLTSLVVDCVDGEVARYTRTFSALGGWLDVASDRVKEYAVYGGLAVGAARADGGDLWGLALAAMAVLVVRHFVDFGYAAWAAGAPDRSAVAALSEATSRRPPLLWAKRAVILPVGERTVLLVAGVPLLGARAALAGLLAWGLVAAAYTTAGRLARAWAARGRTDEEAAARLTSQCDGTPWRHWPVGGVLGWLCPAACRLTEVLAVVGVCAWAGGDGLFEGAYAALAAAAFRGYDVAYRQRLTGVAQPRDALTWCGWPVRVAVVALIGVGVRADVLVVSGDTVLILGAAAWGLAALVVNAVWWRARPRSATAP